MKTYFYGSPSHGLLRAAFAVRSRAHWLRWPIVLGVAAVLMLVIPPAWLLVKAGEVGHAIAGWCGFNSRDW
jgi:hypothetical protein